MKRRIKNCVILFVCVMAIAAVSGMLFPEELAQTTGTEVVAEKMLIPGGHSVGIQMNVKGALIVGVEADMGSKVGDMLVEVNGQAVDSPEDVMNIVSRSEDSVEITVIREKKRLQYTVNPYYDESSKSYKLGFWIKEKIAGIGTLTYFDPESKKFGALGHGIYEPETGTLLTTRDGLLLNTAVNQIKEGKVGAPGELGGVIYNFDTPMGQLEKNTEFGIYGTVISEDRFTDVKPMIVASADDIQEGPAYILSTIDGTEVRKYEIEITKVHRQYTVASRGIELKVTDETLLENCGGIVQGMSGSPIIQDGKLVGAVTHVLVNDPTRGYGIFIENMLDAAE